jgi:Co/Zn/Cd efflux system component
VKVFNMAFSKMKRGLLRCSSRGGPGDAAREAKRRALIARRGHKWESVSELARKSPWGAVGVAALIANGTVLGLLTTYRRGDANMRSVWICTRNDALGNVAVLLAAAGVFGSGHGWPDSAVAIIMAALALWGATQIIRYAIGEIRPEPRPVAAE